MRQLPLGVQLRISSRFETFHAGANHEAIAELRRDGARPPLWLYGPAGVGKTHLLQAACAEAGSQGLTAAYLPLDPAAGLSPALLAGCEQLDLLLLDDLDRVAGDGDWERALFRLYNELAERNGRWVCTAAATPAASGFRLPDLASRLAAATTYRLQALAEGELPAALAHRATGRGLELPPETLQYLARRAPRDFAALCRLLDRIDAAALAAQRKLTVPFVREVLEGDAG